MKFGKEFASQMVPEWQEAYMDYDFLKTLLKEILRFQQRTGPTAKPTGLKRKMTLYRAFSGLTQRNNTASPATDDIEKQVILMNPMRRDGTEGFETTFLMAAEEGGEYELIYFRRLDDELNKVLKFYKSKVEEVMKEASLLNRQMDAFIAFRIKVERPQHNFDYSGELTRIASDVDVSAAALSAATPSGARASRRVHLDIIEEEGSSRQEPSDDSGEDKSVKKVKSFSKNDHENINKPKKIKGNRPAPLDILNHVKMNNTLETPRSTIKGVLNVPNHAELKFNRENLKKVEEQLNRAFTEFYNKLRLLQSYSFLNILAFSKIMKKYDKITSRNASKSYIQMVDNSYIGTSDELTKLMERVESTFVKHFCNSNRSKAMGILRPRPKRERHRVTFSVGFFAGCTAALILALVLIIRARHILTQEGGTKYMETMFPLYSLFGFIVLHMLMYAANIYYWRRYRVNYSFIFGFKQGTELGYRPVLLVSFGFAVVALASVLANLDMEMDPKTLDYKAFTELLPLGVVLLAFAVLLCPFNIIYRSSRYFLLACAFHCICAPLYKVTLPDFFLADQLTSQVQAIRSLEFYVCYYGWGDFKKRENSCKQSAVYNTFYFIIAALPYWSRLLQCLRRLYEEKDVVQGLNALKYFSTIVAVSLRTAYGLSKGYGWRVMAGISSAIAAIVSTYWDLVLDWGLLQKNSKNRWLRDKLLISNKNVYFGAMVLNVLLRFAWLQTVLDFKLPFLHNQALIAIVASLEIIRRGIWNFFRLENEHLNNVGKYRAFKSVPLPFNYEEDEEKDE